MSTTDWGRLPFRTARVPHHMASQSKDSPVPFDPSIPDSIDTLQVVFKVVERCNINCTYCYYFNMGDETALERPAIASLSTARALGEWIAQGCKQLRIPKVRISFHGGEPMIMKPALFRAMCEAFQLEIGSVADLSFSIQTNGTILNDDWLSAFREHAVGVGVSIDGDESAHDRYRLDHRGRSTFTATETTLKRLTEWADGDPGLMPSTISVYSRHNDYRRVYEYIRGFGVERMGFLLPDCNPDDPDPGSKAATADYGRAMYELFEAWLTEDNPKIYIKFIHNALAHFNVTASPTSTDGFVTGVGGEKRDKKSYQVVIARSDGTVAIDDSYMPALAWYTTAPLYSVHRSTLKEFLSDPVFTEIETASATLPTECESCTWKELCGGGDLENRFSAERRFDNPSVYCEAYKVLYRGLCDLLIENGYPQELVTERFGYTLA